MIGSNDTGPCALDDTASSRRNPHNHVVKVPIRTKPQFQKANKSMTNGVVKTAAQTTTTTTIPNERQRCVTCFRLLRDWRGQQLVRYHDTKRSLGDILHNNSNLVDNNRVIELIRNYLVDNLDDEEEEDDEEEDDGSVKVCETCVECLNQIDNHMQTARRLSGLMRSKLEKSVRLLKKGGGVGGVKRCNSTNTRISRRRKLRKRNHHQHRQRHVLVCNSSSSQASLSNLNSGLSIDTSSNHHVVSSSSLFSASSSSLSSKFASPPLRKFAMVDANDVCT